jgi:predicted component of type VI protein secretion system
MLDVDRVANGGRALRVVVEMVDEESFASASYQSVVGRALHLDSPVLLSRMVFPGSQERLEFAEPSGGLIGIYVLFTQPGEGEWKRLVHPPFPDEIHLRLMENEVEPVPPPGFFDRVVFW